MAATSSTNPLFNTPGWITLCPQTEYPFSFHFQVSSSGGELEKMGYFQTNVEGKDLSIPFITHDPTSYPDAASRHSVLTKFCKHTISFSATNRTKFIKYLNKHNFHSGNPHNFKQIMSKAERIYEASTEERIRKLLPTPLTSSEYERIIISSELAVLPPSEKPFALLSAILKSSGTFEKLLTNALLLLNITQSKQKIPNLFATQCTYSALVLGNLFFGPKFTHLIKCFSKINLFITTENTFYVNQNKYTCSRIFNNIFKGLIITEIRRKHHSFFNEENDSNLINKALELKEKFLYEIFDKYFTPKLNKKANNCVEYKEEYFTQLHKKLILKCPFNLKNLENLRSEMIQNMEFISAENTCFYFIELKNTNKSSDHSFIIEQFQRQSDQKVCYRLYQSWLGQTTLSEDMDKRGYDREGKNAIEWEQIKRLLKSFKSYLMDPKDGEKDDLQDIFGCRFVYTEPPRTVFNEETKVVRSRDLIYWCEFKNPNDCWRHFMELATSFPPITTETNS